MKSEKKKKRLREKYVSDVKQLPWQWPNSVQVMTIGKQPSFLSLIIKKIATGACHAGFASPPLPTWQIFLILRFLPSWGQISVFISYIFCCCKTVAVLLFAFCSVASGIMLKHPVRDHSPTTASLFWLKSLR